MWTVVYVNDDGTPYAYGRFGSHEAAAKRAERMERDLDADRDDAGGGVGIVMAVPVRPLREW